MSRSDTSQPACRIDSPESPRLVEDPEPAEGSWGWLRCEAPTERLLFPNAPGLSWGSPACPARAARGGQVTLRSPYRDGPNQIPCPGSDGRVRQLFLSPFGHKSVGGAPCRGCATKLPPRQAWGTLGNTVAALQGRVRLPQGDHAAGAFGGCLTLGLARLSDYDRHAGRW